MNLAAIKTKAKEMGIDLKNKKKGDLILSIQAAEGNIPCFQTEKETCDQQACLWWEDCISG